MKNTNSYDAVGSRVCLRPLLPADVTDAYLQWFADDPVTSFLEVDGKGLTKQMVVDYINEGPATKSYYMYAICLSDTGQHIGNMKVGPINHKHLISDLVCVIGDKSFWGIGLATDAIALGNELAFKKYGIRKLHGQIYADNIGSIKAYSKAGWIIEGVIQGRYWKDNKPMDQVLVSCNNPAFFEQPGQTDYSVRELERLISFRETFFR